MAEEKKEKEYIVKILETGRPTHDVKSFIIEKPEGYEFVPGQATELSINKPGLKEEKRPFTFTTHPENPYLEFTIKMYENHEDGVTKHLKELKEGDEFILREPWGAIHYDGPGTFIAGGAGITPFIAIFRDLRKKGKLEGNTLLFSNKTSEDIINQYEFKEMLGDNAIFILTDENNPKYETGRIDEKYLKEKISDFSQKFYICGPVPMVGEIQAILKKLGSGDNMIIVET